MGFRIHMDEVSEQRALLMKKMYDVKSILNFTGKPLSQGLHRIKWIRVYLRKFLLNIVARSLWMTSSDLRLLTGSKAKKACVYK